MNYRHSYHAGNFADVFKHIVMIALLQSLARKDTPFCFFDTHAGSGRYDLTDTPAQKSKESNHGIAKIWGQDNLPPLIATYLACVQKINDTDDLHFYPGSPLIARDFMRRQDRMVLTERQDQEHALLKKVFPHQRNIDIHLQDGYQGLKAFLPPKERRGLVLIDPPYEANTELTTAANALAAAVARWETGIYALWYPIKERRSIIRFQRALKTKVTRPMLAVEMSIYPDDMPIYLNGCGMIIINPPFQFEQEIEAVLPWLWRTLSPEQQGRYTCVEIDNKY